MTDLMPRTMPAPFSARGQLSELLLDILSSEPDDALVDGLAEATAAALTTDDVLRDDDVQLSMFLLFALSYGSVPGLDASWEWHPSVVSARGLLERAMEAQLRELVPVPAAPEATRDAVARCLFELTAPSHGPSVSRFVLWKTCAASWTSRYPARWAK